jgi:hypothetical protein
MRHEEAELQLRHAGVRRHPFRRSTGFKIDSGSLPLSRVQNDGPFIETIMLA